MYKRAAPRAPVWSALHRHVVVRLKHRGVVYVFREIAASTDYLGEVVRTQAGPMRVHVWRVLPPGIEPRYIIQPDPTPGSGAIMWSYMREEDADADSD